MSSTSRKTTKSPYGTMARELGTTPPEHKRIAHLAYLYWEARGRPDGSSEEDWFRAEEELRRRKSTWDASKARRQRSAVRPANSRLSRAESASK